MSSETQTNEPKMFSTRDISLAAALMSTNFKLAGINYQIEGLHPKQIGYFYFVETQALTNQIGKYLQGDVLVEPREFTNNIRTLKAEVVGTYKNPNNNSIPSSSR